MASLYVPEEAFFGELTNVWRLFAPDRNVERAFEVPKDASPGLAVFPGSPQDGRPAAAELYMDGKLLSRKEDDSRFLELRSGERSAKRAVLHQAKRALYRLLSEHFCSESPWGALTGIRPTKLFRELALRYGEEAAEDEFREKYLVSSARTSLAQQITRIQKPYLSGSESAVVYVGIPFCPGRCRYCSFIAEDESASREARGGYLEALLLELERGAHIAGRYRVDAVYVGGGTPTSLTVDELDELLRALRLHFGKVREFTVEAGRPDTITDGKLDVLCRHGADRICINPQTTSDTTLEAIGRRHTAADFEAAMKKASGRFRSLNTDLIAGLPGEDAAQIRRTLEDILRWKPENITVHALSVKNAAQFASDRYSVLPAPDAAAAMAAAAKEMLTHAGYRPYYLYRQKYMSGNLENIGYALPGFESIYNIANMEETASVLAFGAGAISKRILQEGERIERAANVKNPAQYVARAEEMAERKEALFGTAT